MKPEERITPEDLAQRWKVRALQVRRVLRSLWHTGGARPRTPGEVARVTAEAKRRGWC